MLLRVLTVWLRLGPFLIAFMRDRHRWLVVGRGRVVSDEGHRARARRLTARVASLGPTFIKLGQLFAIRGDIIPKIYAEELAQLHDRVPPFEIRQLKTR